MLTNSLLRVIATAPLELISLPPAKRRNSMSIMFSAAIPPSLVRVIVGALNVIATSLNSTKELPYPILGRTTPTDAAHTPKSISLLLAEVMLTAPLTVIATSPFAITVLSPNDSIPKSIFM